MKRTTSLTTALALSAIVVSLPPVAHAAFPEKPVTFIVPFGAGGGFDGLARGLVRSMEKTLGVAIAIKNNPGAGGRRGSIRLFKSKPDGYTVGFGHFVPFQTDELLLGKKPAIDYRKFSIVYKISHSRHFVFVSKKRPFKSVKDLKAAGRAIKFATTGHGSITWVEGSALGSSAGFPVSFVSGYKKLPAAALAVAKGSADAGVGSAHHFHGVAKDVRVIAFLGKTRDPHYPDAPSAIELGYPKLTALGSPRVVSAPPGTSKSRLTVLRTAVKKAVADPEFVKWAAKAGYFLDPTGPAGTWEALEVNAGIYKGLKSLLDKAKRK